jgi:hypothetical protein
MNTIKLTSAASIEIATEIAGILKGSMTVAGKVARFDDDDAGEIEEIAAGAVRYWKSLGKRTKMLAAESIRSTAAQARISAAYARTF